MKMKSFVMIAMISLLAAPLAYIAPAMAEDEIDQDPTLQMLSDSGMQPQSNDSQNSSTNSNSNNNDDNKDSASPDTATGDDDY